MPYFHKVLMKIATAAEEAAMHLRMACISFYSPL